MATSSRIVRTGCLACHARGVRCDPHNQACSQYTSTGWGSNKPPGHRYASWTSRANDPAQTLTYLVHTWDGTQRERQSLHFFCLFSAPELAGSLDSEFWQIRLPQATLRDTTIKHAVAAIGAAHEYQLRMQAARDNTRTRDLESFGIRQCNKAIQDLLRPSNTRYEGLVRAMVASVLFACFENMNRHRGRAVIHVQYSNKILEQAKILREGRKNNMDQGSLPVDFDHLEPLIAHYGYQNDHYILDGQDEVDDTNPIQYDLDEKGRPVFRTIGDARIMLTGAIARLGVEVVRLEDPNHTSEDIANVSLVKSRYSDFLWRWNLSFDRFTTRHRRALDSVALDGCRVLRAHLLAGTVLTDIDFRQGEHGWQVFIDRYQTIVELLEEVMEKKPSRRSTSLDAPQDAYLSSTMRILEPLYLVATRCLDFDIAQRAQMLLAKLPSSDGAQSKWRTDFIERILCACTGKPFPSELVHSQDGFGLGQGEV